MSHLHDFPPPSTTDATLCERNSKLVDKSATNVLDYRKISVKETLLHKKSLACSEMMTPQEVFKSVEEGAMDKIVSRWESGGLVGVLEELETMEQTPAKLKVVVNKLHSLVEMLIQWKEAALPKKVVTEVPGKRQIMVCHPHTGRLAVITKESTVKLLNLNRIGETDQEVVLRDTASNTIDIGGSGTALKCADVSKVVFPTDDTNIEIGGLICDMAWDPTDSRLAVTFYDGTSGNRQPFIALYHTRKLPNLHLVPCGFVRGSEGQTPINIDFVHGYDKGALLSVYWSDEEISLVPLLFNHNLSSPRFIQAEDVSLDTTTVTTAGVDNIGEVPSMQNRTVLYSASDE